MRVRAGVNTIEIVLVVAIICLLVAIAFPWFTRAGRQQAAYDARQTLEHLRDAEDGFFAKHHRYGTLTDSLDMRVPPQVRVEIGGSGLESGRGWNASASATGATCYIGVGVDTVIASVHTGDGHVVCQ